MAKPKILVVEDEGILAQDIADTLTNFSYGVSAIVDSGEQALKKAKAQQPDLILMDIKINGNLDGIDAAEQIKELFNIPVVFLTAYADDDTLKRARITEPFGYVLKPFREKELQAAIEMALYKQRMETERMQAQQALQESEERYYHLFNEAPISLWEEDFSEVGRWLESLRSTGVRNLREHLKTYPKKVQEAVQLVRVIDVNNATLEMLEADSKEQLLANLPKLFKEETYEKFIEELLAIWEGKEQVELELTGATLKGNRIDCILHWDASKVSDRLDLSRVIVAVSEITDRRQAEEALRMAMSEVKKLKNQLQAENIYLQEEIKREHNFEEIIGNSDTMLYVLNRVEQMAPTDTTVLILGETGTGKELFARAIHSKSQRKDTPFIKINCAALPAHLIESELFGHEKGAFTGAQSQRRGRFELADGGTIFLDEIGELLLELQPKLLRVLQDGELERLGGEVTLKVDVRVLAATNRDLASEVREGRFRQDLFYRLNVFPLTVPPLRDRMDDIELLARFFVRKFSNKLGKRIEKVSQQTMSALKNYNWPGNVRELENVIERAVIVTSGSELRLADKLEPHKTQELQSNTDRPLAEIEREYVVQVLEKTNWRIEGDAGAAKILDLHPNTLRNRMRKLNIRRSITAINQ